MASKHFDLTPVMAPYFDPHMFNFILDHLREAGIYQPKIISKEKIKVLFRTKMLDLIEDEYARFPDDAEMQQEFKQSEAKINSLRDGVFAELDHVPANVTKAIQFFNNDDLVKSLRESSTLSLEHISSAHGITWEVLEQYHKWSKLQYECGQYVEAETILENFLSVNQPMSPSYLNALWGRLACRIIQAKWDLSLNDLEKVKEAIDNRNIPHMDQLRQRAWLLHWSLLVYMNQRDGVDPLTDFFSEKSYLQTIENLCPWLLRYYTAFVVLSPNGRRNKLKPVLEQIRSMAHQYSDPITEFLSSLFNQFDFDEAQVKLKECQTLIKNDFFLQIFADNFMKQARLLICEMYCTINHHVDIVMLADKLQLSEEEAEKWMVDIVRAATSGPTFDAKIDSAGKRVIMSTPSRSAHQTVIEKTKEVNLRSGILVSSLSNLLAEQHILVPNAVKNVDTEYKKGYRRG
jgi:translation initiation factor 3 subunit E